jgi:hypothetical protein
MSETNSNDITVRLEMQKYQSSNIYASNHILILFYFIIITNLLIYKLNWKNQVMEMKLKQFKKQRDFIKPA